jgi:hypothetical protein
MPASLRFVHSLLALLLSALSVKHSLLHSLLLLHHPPTFPLTSHSRPAQVKHIDKTSFAWRLGGLEPVKQFSLVQFPSRCFGSAA